MDNDTRRVAAHKVTMPDGTLMAPGVVEINHGSVTRAYPLDGEQPRTEWLGGNISVRTTPDGTLRAYKDNEQI